MLHFVTKYRAFKKVEEYVSAGYMLAQVMLRFFYFLCEHLRGEVLILCSSECLGRVGGSLSDK